jgi:hypothetical protein
MNWPWQAWLYVGGAIVTSTMLSFVFYKNRMRERKMLYGHTPAIVDAFLFFMFLTIWPLAWLFIYNQFTENIMIKKEIQNKIPGPGAQPFCPE